MLGIGMHHQGDPNGIAWKQNHDFENLLKRLNEGREDTGLFYKAGELGDTCGEAKSEERCEREEEKSLRMEDNESRKKDKRKRKAEVTLEEGEGEKVKRLKKSKEDGDGEKKTKRKANTKEPEKVEEEVVTILSSTTEENTGPGSLPPVVLPAPSRAPCVFMFNVVNLHTIIQLISS